MLPRVFARPLELRRGQSMTERQLVDRLNDLGYTQRARADNPGEFAMATSLISIMPRAAELKGKLVRVVFPKPPPPGEDRRGPRRGLHACRTGWSASRLAPRRASGSRSRGRC